MKLIWLECAMNRAVIVSGGNANSLKKIKVYWWVETWFGEFGQDGEFVVTEFDRMRNFRPWIGEFAGSARTHVNSPYWGRQTCRIRRLRRDTAVVGQQRKSSARSAFAVVRRTEIRTVAPHWCEVAVALKSLYTGHA